MSIPKIIHYCWLSNDPLPDLAKKCIKTWQKYLPGYKLILWDLNRFKISSTIWTKEAFENKKYAFAADYIRCYALYNYGGIYLDTDVQVLRSFDDLLHLPYFMGIENPAIVEAAVIGFSKGHYFLKEMLEYYENRPFVGTNGKFDVTPLPFVMEKIISEKFIINKITQISQFNVSEQVINIFPEAFFSPKSCADGKIYLTDESYTIHHYNQSWQSPIRKYGRKLILMVGGVKLKEAIKNNIKKII